MISKYTAYLLCFFSLLGCALQAQDQGHDILHLRSGVMLQGQIISYDPQKEVTFYSNVSELTQTYPIESVLKIEQHPGLQGESQTRMVPQTDIEKLLATLTFTNGQQITGEIVAYTAEGEVTLQTDTNVSQTFKEENITAITYEVPEKIVRAVMRNERRDARKILYARAKPVYEFREQGWFHHTSLAFTFGRQSSFGNEINDPFFGPSEYYRRQSVIGYNVQHISGKQFNRWTGVGLGVSYDSYNSDFQENLLTVFGHYRAYLTKTITAPYVGLNAGWGFTLTPLGEYVKEARGGWMFNPELGVRLGASDNINFTAALGYRFQDAFYKRELFFNQNIQYQDLVYQRLMVNIGLLF